LAQLLLYDVADCWLRWLADPVNSETQEQLMVARAEIDAACGITEEDDDD
jgi:hypothetical protein